MRKSIVWTFIIINTILSAGTLTESAENRFQPTLESYSLPSKTVAPGGSVVIRLTFTNNGAIPSASSESCFIHFEREKKCSTIQWQFDRYPVTPTTYWETGAPIEHGTYYAHVPKNTPEGEYFIHTGLWNPSTGERSLDVYLPEKVAVKKDAPPLKPIPLQAIAPEESTARESRLIQRIFQGETIQLENRNLLFDFNPITGLFLLKDKETNRAWYSAPDRREFGIVTAEKGNRRVRIPLSQLTVIKQKKQQCVLQKIYEGAPLLEFRIELEGNHPALMASWKPLGEWKLERIEFDSFLWTTDSLGGGAVIPRLLGLYFKADSGYEMLKGYQTYSGVNGANMRMAGILRQKDAALLTWDDVGTTLNVRSRVNPGPSWPGSQEVSIGLLGSKNARSFRHGMCPQRLLCQTSEGIPRTSEETKKPCHHETETAPESRSQKTIRRSGIQTFRLYTVDEEK